MIDLGLYIAREDLEGRLKELLVFLRAYTREESHLREIHNAIVFHLWHEPMVTDRHQFSQKLAHSISSLYLSLF